MEDLKNSSPLLIKYLRAYEQNRASRVFAPLAETYRKLGKVEEALKILKEGIRHHPTYTLGYLVLAHCYFDKNQFEFAYNTLRPLVSDNLDNIGLQKLFAETSEKLFYLEEALETYKYLLFLNPKDASISERVHTLEAILLKESSSYLIIEDKNPKSNNDIMSVDDDWVQIDLSNKKNKVQTNHATDLQQEKPILKVVPSLESSADDWSLKKSGQEKVIDNDFYDVEKATEDDRVEPENEEETINRELINGFEDQAPVMTLTLVDIYCAQKLYAKAEEVLEKILEITPTDSRILTKLNEVKAMSRSKVNLAAKSEDLMQVYDQAMNVKKSKLIDIENKFYAFLEKLKAEARTHT
ncbi:MAG: tetratricopeptide repeat protein [Bacteriovoracaceae bacterium]